MSVHQTQRQTHKQRQQEALGQDSQPGSRLLGGAARCSVPRWRVRGQQAVQEKALVLQECHRWSGAAANCQRGHLGDGPGTLSWS